MTTYGYGRSGGGIEASPFWQNAVATASLLPLTATIGAIITVIDTKKLYIWTGSTWDIVSSSTGIVNEVVEQITLTLADIANKHITLSHVPVSASAVELTVIGGIDQEFGVDFTVTSNTLSWSALSLEGILSAGDILKINYLY